MSIPTSLIVVVLVLAWLVVLVPMVARRREAVPEAEMVGGTFRVLQRSDGTRRRPAFRRRPAVEVGDWEDPRGQELSGDDELDEELLDEEYDDADGDGYGDRDDGYAEYGEDDDELDSDESEMSRTAEVPVATPAGQFFGRRSAGSHPYRPAGQPSSGSHPYRPAARQLSVHVEDEPQFDGFRPEPEQYDRVSASAVDDADDDGYASDGPAQHPDDVHLRPIPRRAGRGGYDPEAAEVARQFKYSRRRRVAVILLLAALLFSAAAILIKPVLWAGTAVFVLLLIGYLAYLRRQVRIEGSIRERRLARLRRARQIRPEYDYDRAETGADSNAFARSAVPAAQVPPNGYRRGREVVDLDDDDPSFDDLEYYQPLAYRRASGQ